VVNYKESEQLAAELQAAGGRVTPILVPVIGHNECWHEPDRFLAQWVAWLRRQ